MSKCILCKKNDGVYFHHDGGMVCEKCEGAFFTCPECGVLFNNDDYENGDHGNGYCKECTEKYGK